jgi:mercuric ion transport protein
MQEIQAASNGRAYMGETRHLTAPAAMIDAEARRAQKLVAAGGVLAAIAASSCCIVPLLLFSLGVSGAWIGNLTRLAPYQPFFVAVTLACLGCGYWLVWRARRAACAEGAACSRTLPKTFVTIALVAATLLVAAAVAFDFPAPLILA